MRRYKHKNLNMKKMHLYEYKTPIILKISQLWIFYFKFSPNETRNFITQHHVTRGQTTRNTICLWHPCGVANSVRPRTHYPDPVTNAFGFSSKVEKKPSTESFYFVLLQNQLNALAFFVLPNALQSILILGFHQLHRIAVIFGLRDRTCTSEEVLPRRSSLPTLLSASISVTQIVIILTL